MSLDASKWFGHVPLFDPQDGTTVFAPPSSGHGYWVGAPSAIYDPVSRTFYLAYRTRRPLAQGRGGHCHIASSEDGIHFTNIWTAAKEQFDAESIERSALIKSPEGLFRLYVSYVDNRDRRWRIDLLEADSPDGLDPSAQVQVMAPEDAHSEGVKDPHVVMLGGRYYMFVHYAPKSLIPPGATYDELHGTGNIFATEKGTGSEGLAVSDDGVHFRWLGDVLPPGPGWDRKLVRIDTVIFNPPVFTALYSGRSGVQETYEDATGLATSLDLRKFHRLTPDAPALRSPHSTGALRYTDIVTVGGEIFFYYEYAREDGSHELRVSRVAAR